MPTPHILYALTYYLDKLIGNGRQTPEPNNQASKLGLYALAVAQREIGKGEEGMNNYGPDVVRYRQGIDDGGPWCADFVCYCFREAARQVGVPVPFRLSRSAKRLYREMCITGYEVHPELIRPGDVACWHRGAANAPTGHVGIVIEVRGVRFSTIEGNRGSFPSMVGVFEHQLGEGGLIGFARSAI